ncbi:MULTISPECIES: tetratricopeptide repeat protein [Colwellia]|uniref:Sel1 domain-containing protein n=1 Tax=Colwellia marinimaniae TaxID=1513592 RepID=A0ABQ0MZY9_9GAMM|nr:MULTISPECIES: tetratricopeptide repeat protein [Colwellia]GAW97930.1 Sel1 domain-containing protein [Colwellia marinimaniae]
MFPKASAMLKIHFSVKKILSAMILLASFSTFSQGNDLEQGIYEFNRGKFQAAISQFRPLVNEGYAPAQYQMALIYQFGYSVPKDGMKALELFQLAAAQNYPDAQFELALLYSEGKLVKKDLKKYFELTHKAAKKGLASAQFNLGVAYANGTGIKQDDFKASRWYQNSANQNYALAQYNLALLYSEGKGVEKSTPMSFVWNTMASWNGYPNAEKSRIMDERDLSRLEIIESLEKANQIYKKIRNQLALQEKMAEKQRYY